jgi:uncharacterized membrane protein
MLVGEEAGFVEGRGDKSLIVEVGRRAVRVPLLSHVRLALLPIEFLILLLSFFLLVLIIFIIGTLSNKMTGLTTLEA